MRTRIIACAICGLIAIAAVALMIVEGRTPSSPNTSQPIEIRYSDNLGSLPPAYARERTIVLAKDVLGAISGSYTMKDGYQKVLASAPIALTEKEFGALVDAAKEVSPKETEALCVGGGGKDFFLTIGSTTREAYSVKCGEGTANQSLESFYADFIAPLIEKASSK